MPDPTNARYRAQTTRWLAVLLVAVGAARVAATYPVFSQTYDEAPHLAAGMEWLDRGRFTYELKHPPLARVAAALGPYLDGLRSHGRADIWEEGNEILYARGTYLRNLTLARLGILPFFVLAAVCVWLWARRLFGEPVGLIALGAFTMSPPILAHAGLATMDMALAAFVIATSYAFALWLERPDVRRSALLGASVGFALLAKFSAILFLPSIALVTLGAWWWGRRRAGADPSASRLPRTRGRIWQYAVVAACAAAFVAWAGYRFPVTYWHGLVPIPSPAVVRGIAIALTANRAGHPAYLFGQTSLTGWWYYFPVVLAVKTPLAFLLLSGAGVVGTVRLAVTRGDWRPLVPPLAAGAVLASSMAAASINIGVRHILPIYGFLAVVAAYGAAWLWRAGRARVAAAGLVLWLGISSALAHPDYLAYFNELAGRHPERVLSDSNLDWGQDLFRLADAIRARGIDSLWIGYFGRGELARMTRAHVRELRPHQPVTGWVAVSETILAEIYTFRWGHRDEYTWLGRYEPVARVGKTIRLYYIAPEPSPPPNPAPVTSPGGAGAKR